MLRGARSRRAAACLRLFRRRAGAAISGQAAHQGRSAPDRGQHCEAAGTLSDVGVCRFHFDLNQIAELPESATEARSRLGDNAMSSAAGFPHSVAVALGLLFSFALSLLVLVAFGGLSLF